MRDLVADTLFTVKRAILGPRRCRRTHVVGVGVGKSGTHSLAHMFSGAVRAAHEPDAAALVSRIVDWHASRISDEELTKWILERDRRLSLEVDVSGINSHVVPILVNAFPNARFVLTIRDCYTWLDSQLNHLLRFPNQSLPIHWAHLRDLNYPEPHHYSAAEKLLERDSLYPLSAHLSHWNVRNQRVIDLVPKDRLLIVRTDELQGRAFEIADFVGLPRRTIRLDRTHEFQNPSKRAILLEMDPDFVEASVRTHCRSLMTQFFPEITSAVSALSKPWAH